jgi:hypothetical protein
MKSYWIAAAVVLFAVWPSSSKAYVAGPNQSKAEDSPAQQTQASIASPTTPASAAAPSNTAGSYMLVELSKTLNVKKLKPGDKIKAEVSQDVVAHGKIIIPVETELVGHVTEVRALEADHPESRLGIVFDRILLKHFRDINFEAVVQAVAPPAERRSRVDQPSQMLPPSMLGGSSRGTSMGPVSNGSSGSSGSRGQSSSPSVTVAPQASSDMSSVFQTGVTVKESPSTNTASGTSAVQLNPVSGGGKPMSVGMPLGVSGIKGVGLSVTPSPETPGPVIVSTAVNIKLESGTQILLHVLKVEAPKAEPPK